jgi:hypothetical protein
MPQVPPEHTTLEASSTTGWFTGQLSVKESHVTSGLQHTGVHDGKSVHKTLAASSITGWSAGQVLLYKSHMISALSHLFVAQLIIYPLLHVMHISDPSSSQSSPTASEPLSQVHSLARTGAEDVVDGAM